MSNQKKLIDLIIPLILTLVIGVSILVWLKIDTNLPHWDMGRHLFLTTIYRDLWHRVFLNPVHFASVATNYYYYPPLVHNVGLLFESIFGFRADAAVASNIVWISIIIYSVYSLVKNLFGRWEAIASILFLCASPMLIGQFREFQVDMPMTAMFALSLLLGFKAKNFSNKKYSILFGLASGFGMMVKWSFVFFVFPVCLVFVLLAFLNKKTNKKIILSNIIYFFLAGLVIAGPWYIRNITALKRDFLQNGVRQAAIEGDPYGINPDAFLWYLRRLVSNYLYLPLVAVFLVGTFALIKNYIRTAWIFILLGVVFYLIISYLPNKDIRYIMPEIVILAIIGGLSVSLVKSNFYRIACICLIFFIFLANNFLVAFGRYSTFSKKELYINNNYTYGTVYAQNGYTSNSPKTETCPMDEIITSIPAGKSARTIGNTSIDFSDWALAYYLEKNGRVWAGQTDDLSNSDYLIYRNTDKINDGIANNVIYITSTLISSFDCVDGSKVEISHTNK